MIEVIQAIQKAKTALMSAQPPSREDRQSWCLRLAEVIRQNQSKIIASEKGPQAFSDEILIAMTLKPAELAFRRAASELLQPEPVGESHRPTGLISLILPQVLSFRVLCERLAPALAAGNAVLVKPSSRSQATGELLDFILSEAKIPPGYVQTIYGSGAEVGALMTQHPAIKAVSFTGRAETAEKILSQPGIAQKKLQFSLSGNSSAILLGDSWSETQLQTLADSCFRGSGCWPWNTTKILVPESVQAQFIQSFLPLASAVMCPLATEADAAALEVKVQALKKEGGKILCGGQRQGSSFQATVFLDLPHCSEAQQLEMRGPVVLVSGVKYSHEAAKWNNTGDLAYSTLILGDQDKALRLLEKLESGTVFVNRWLEPEDGVLIGGQQSNLGILDFKVFGAFFSNCRKVVTSPVKSMTSN